MNNIYKIIYNIYIFNLNPKRIFEKNLIINIIICFKKITYNTVVGISKFYLLTTNNEKKVKNVLRDQTIVP